MDAACGRVGPFNSSERDMQKEINYRRWCETMVLGLGSRWQGQIPIILVSHYLIICDGYKLVKQYRQSWRAEKSGMHENVINKSGSKVLPHQAWKGALQRGICLSCLLPTVLCTQQKSTGDDILSRNGPADFLRLSQSILALCVILRLIPILAAVCGCQKNGEWKLLVGARWVWLSMSDDGNNHDW